MTYSEALAWLYSTQQFGIKLGLENTRRLLDELGCPERQCRFIHVAGTNGKGSVCAFIDSILRAAGIRAGLYTSPHLVRFPERIRVDGSMIDESAAARGLSEIRRVSAGWKHSPTFFEVATVLALLHFAREGVDWAVLETGMGGRLDATNVVSPRASVITPVAMDHQQWLGKSLAAIAREKAGIIKTGIPLVCAPQEPEAMEVIEAAARDRSARLTAVKGPLAGMKLGLRGAHQRLNAAVAVEAIRAAGIPVGGEALALGLADVVWPCRFQEIDRFVLDGAHNPHAAQMLVQTWRETYGQSERACVIFGALRDKDYPAMLSILSSIAGELIFVPVPSLRSESAARLLETAGRGSIADGVAEAIERGRKSDRRLLVTGSLFLAGEALRLIASRADWRSPRCGPQS